MNNTYPLAGSHILLTTLSTTSFPPSFKAFVTLLLACSWVAYSRSTSIRWSTVCWQWRMEPCSRTGSKHAWVNTDSQMNEGEDLLCWIQYAPHCDFTTSPKTAEPWLRSSSTIPSFADSSRVSKACCKIVGTKANLTQSHYMKNTYLDNERHSFMACKGGPFAFRRFLDTRKEACISDKWNTREKRTY